MPKKQRQFEIGNIYHVINRGVEKRKIFMKSQDYSRFILALEFFNRKEPIDLWPLFFKGGPGPPRERIECERRRNFRPIIELMAFALMPNHYHLVIREIRERGISLFMNKLGGYSSYFNKQYNRSGPLFQSRFKLVPIKNDIQLLNIFAYVHTNPVELWESDWKEFKVKNKTNAINWLESYRWSSYQDYVGNQNTGFSNATQRSFFLDFLGGEKGCRQAVEDWIKFKAENSAVDFNEVE